MRPTNEISAYTKPLIYTTWRRGHRICVCLTVVVVPQRGNLLSSRRNPRGFHTQRIHRTFGAALALLTAVPPFVISQTPLTTTSTTNFAAPGFSMELPDSPGSLISSSMDPTDPSVTPGDPQTTPPTSPPPPNPRTRYSPHFAMTVAPNEIAQPMTVRHKVVGGLGDSVSLFAATGWIVSAGWGQLTDRTPNYGTDKGAFGQRLGATALRNSSQVIFRDCFFAPVFREDPRYYIMGRSHNVLKRGVYAATRALVGRTDSGHTTPNFALLAGNAAGAALTVTYYPAINTTFDEVAKNFGTSVGGSALGFVVTEFIGDALQYAHLRKKD